VSMSHGEEFSRVHSPSALWVQSISARGFEVCSREQGLDQIKLELSTGWPIKIIQK